MKHDLPGIVMVAALRSPLLAAAQEQRFDRQGRKEGRGEMKKRPGRIEKSQSIAAL